MRRTSLTWNHSPDERHGGAVIILSLALLMSLLFLGLFFFSFVDDESRSADIYARQSQPVVAVSNQHVLNHGLSQVTVGTNDSDPNEPFYAPYSALFGGRYSMLAHLIGPIGEHDWDGSGGLSVFGGFDEDIDGDGYYDPWTPTDFEMFNGAGTRVFWNGITMTFQVDTNNDGVADTDVPNLRLHAGPLAGVGFDPTTPANLFNADAGYTYPDLNSLFLYHQSVLFEDDNVNGTLDAGEDRNGNGILDFYTAIKPSFEAPAVMYASGATPANPSYADNTHDLTAQGVLRPHSAHAHAGGTRYLAAATAEPGTGRIVPAFEPNYLLEPTDNDNMGVWNRLGTANADVYDFHADADGDGVNDAFLVDLDYPLIEFPDGRKAVPLYFWRIEDLDALVNLNTAGDMPLYRMAERNGTNRGTLLNTLVSDTRFITGANYGQSPSEINPGIPLRSDPGDPTQFDATALAAAADQYNAYYTEQAGNSSPASARLNIGNTELLWLMTGRHVYDGSGGVLPEDYDLPGRYGEPDGIVSGSAFFAAAGNTGADAQGRIYDDDSDSNLGRHPNGGAASRGWFPRLTGQSIGQPQLATPIVMPPAVHPLDGTGFGDWLQGTPMTTPGMVRAIKGDPGDTNNPSRWQEYVMTGTPLGNFPMWQYQGAALLEIVPWHVNGFLQAFNMAVAYDAFWDEPDELVVDDSDPTFLNPADEPFPASEMPALHASDADWTRLNTTSRLRDLAPINFTINFAAEQIRRQFTTVSWDRPEFSLPRNGQRIWEPSDAVANNPAQTDTTSVREYPPRFGTVAATPPDYAKYNYISANDPLRPELRRLLYVDYTADQGNAHPQQRLQLNGILSDDSLGSAGGVSCFDKNGNARFRPLVPHPVFNSPADGAANSYTPAGMVHNNGAALPHTFAAIGTGNTAGKQAQEWWARYDRQRLARDIYTMLWLLGSPPDVNGDSAYTALDNPAANPHPYTIANGYPDLDGDGRADVIDQMAQFAVNVVDAMDHDSVITKFEFDENLADGWSSAPTEVVYGVEAQALTFSEGLWIHAPQVLDAGSAPFDHPATFYDDGTGDHHFMYIELRNALPSDVKLAAGTFQIEREEAGAVVPGATITFDGARSAALTVGPGKNYIIGSHNDPGFVVPTGGSAGKTIASDFRLDFTADATKSTNLEYNAAAPAWQEANPPGGTGDDIDAARSEFKQPIVDFDLCHERDRDVGQNFEEDASSVGYFLPAFGSSPAANTDLVLKRRMNTQADGIINDTANDWIEIDRMQVVRRDFTLTDMSSVADVRTQFINCISRERREPLYANTNGLGGEAATTTNGFYKHSLGGPSVSGGGADPTTQTITNSLKHQRNSVQPSGQPFQIWQPHFDRGFTSVHDLLSVLTIGPSELIYHERTPTAEGGLVVAGSTRMTGIHSAGVRFLNPMDALDPTFPAHLSTITEITAEHYENRWYRLLEFLAVPSHTSDEVADRMTTRRRVPGKINLNTVRHEHVLAAAINDRDQLDLVNSYFPTNDLFLPARNWYLELRRSRDGVNTALGNSVYPPGTPFASPFRPLTYDDPLNPTNPLASTVLRNHAATAGSSLPSVGLFEARNPADVGTDAVDWHTRQRILSRIANLTTNRSHVYVIWGGFQLHDAYDADTTGTSPQVRIGGRLASEPVYRELIVVDMSRLEEAYDTATGAFNFQGFILHREVLP